MNLDSLLDPKLVFSDLACLDRPTLLRALAERIVDTGRLGDVEELYERLWEREQLGSTGIGAGVAVPHCKMSSIDQVVVAVALLPEGVDFSAIDDQPVQLVFLVVSPEDQPAAHLHCLAAISKWIKAGRHVERMLETRDPSSIFSLLSEEI
ncbi:MAG: PTS sugar transporter subunit IIA [bacterium]|nr:PTS sugar transporter subunit IIA [bacterium]